MLPYDFKKLHPFKWFVLQQFPFIEADFDAITNYQLLCKVIEYLNKVIYDMNSVGEQTEKLTTAFINLQNYVNNYFDNLDVQDEINNKLDDMVEAGTLQEIIADYLNSKAIFGYDTVSSMKSATNLIEGSYARTYGFHTINDCGGALYKVRKITNQDTIDERILIALNNDNTLVAEFIKDKTNHINVNQMGAYGDGTHDDSDAIQSAFNISQSYDIIEFATNCKYKITKTIYSLMDRNIWGNNATIYQDEGSYNQGYMFKYNINANNETISIYPKMTVEIKNLVIVGRRSTHSDNNFINLCQQIDIHHCRFENINKGIYFTDDYIDRADIHHIYCNGCGSENTYFIYLGNQGDNKYVHDSQMGGQGEEGSLNFVTCGNNLLNLVIERLVACSMDIYSPATIRNIMLTYYCTIKVHNHYFTIEDIRYSKNKENKRRIELLNDNTTLYRPIFNLKDIIGLFVNTPTEYTTDPVAPIYIQKCNSYCFKNVFSGVRNGNGYLNTWKCFEKIEGTSDVNISVYNDNPEYFNGKTVMNDTLIGYEKNKVNKVGISSLALSQENVDFKITNTTYYYAIQTLLEDKFTTDLSGEQSVTVTDNKSPYLQLSSTPNTRRVRVYRGTSSRSYTHYVDVTTIDGRLIDNGISLNGIKWDSLAEPVTSITNNQSCTKIIAYRNFDKINKKFYCGHSPLVNPVYFQGTFAVGDTVEMNVSPFSKFVYDGTNWNELY